MRNYKEKYGSIFLMEDESPLEEITEPAILFDKHSFTVYKMGNREMVKRYYESSIQKSLASRLYENWILMDLPKDAELLEKIAHNPGYLETFIRSVVKLDFDTLIVYEESTVDGERRDAW
ncbi:hypothetical protein PP175_28745 (plasmid) [Aneurinibacillus sp. Ricciae_BoGa-3]|uniref:hypothetical protein n=1 Tax=Aneurinibacillus sp. Ricciae_BoGa-3 TaxID=3022697 RepID=UPI0023421672|nr:hypothetical protein [Aneurinibacillus sp. Ricciae_BoGa-3]WCK57179.1 hypothetical protein PP175_28745 [Aneurinibacillus sp. Ricciae_BoGa-3]